MATWVKWQPQSMLYPCPECGSGDSVFWKNEKELVTRTIDEDARGRLLDIRRNNEGCSHELRYPSHFVQTSEDDPQAELLDIDWDPPIDPR